VARPIGASVRRRAHTLEEAVGLIVTELRTRKRITQGELAHRLGYNVSYVGAIERGEKSMTLRTLGDLADFFDTTPSKLLAKAERKQQNRSN
jgi:transcriptional regulator with XRE-family HTH domain